MKKKNSSGGASFRLSEDTNTEGKFIITLQFANDNVAVYYICKVSVESGQFEEVAMTEMMGVDSLEDILQMPDVGTVFEEKFGSSFEDIMYAVLGIEVIALGAEIQASPTDGFWTEVGFFFFEPLPDTSYTFTYSGLAGDIEYHYPPEI